MMDHRTVVLACLILGAAWVAASAIDAYYSPLQTCLRADGNVRFCVRNT